MITCAELGGVDYDYDVIVNAFLTRGARHLSFAHGQVLMPRGAEVRGVHPQHPLTELRRGVLAPCVLALLAERPRFGLAQAKHHHRRNTLHIGSTQRTLTITATSPIEAAPQTLAGARQITEDDRTCRT